MSTNKYVNRLIHEKSPYLLQHAHNPVDWYPWGEEAFAKAKAEDKPIFLSIGYSTCHWCHVMERESFENEEVAQLLNRHFISIKVDREERPDIDSIYMTVCQVLTGSGGWPLTVFMTPDKKPFFAGTYFPKDDRYGMYGLISLLRRINKLWTEDRDSIISSGNNITDAIKKYNEYEEGLPSEEAITTTFRSLEQSYDEEYGGFGVAPKFPTPHNLLFLLRYYYKTGNAKALEMVKKTLNCMYKGGIYDHIGYGFSRYSTDRMWLVPHFEKMLHDNALLAIAYLETFHVTGQPLYEKIARQIFTYIQRDMTSPEGGFYSAEDADSEGVEGKFYTWSKKEIMDILGEEEGRKFCEMYDITEAGNFEGVNIPNLIKSIKFDKELYDFNDEKSRTVPLFIHREKRIHPHKDDKILTSWNGLMIAAFAIGGRILGNESYTQAAEKAASFIFSKLIREDGRLMARYRNGDTAHLAYVDDYAFLVWALIELYETTYNPFYLKKALELNDNMLSLFWDDDGGGLFLYGSDGEELIVRPKEIYDGATPSGNSVATFNFLRLARLTGRPDLEEKAQRQFRTFASYINSAGSGHAFMLIALLFSLAGSKEVIIVDGKNSSESDKKAIFDVIQQKFMPFTTTIFYSQDNKDITDIMPYLKNYFPLENKTTVYVCENFSCKKPVTSADEFSGLMH
ncbi:MAG TPA: thioredoxin domain-containing protein [Clostridiaceae bacterium]|nr:thioredoxin domain-containing protein [Clostridiaceae bacterium]